MERVLLTGATGFLGSHLLEALLRRSYDVTILKRSTSNTQRIDAMLTSVQCFDVDEVPLEDAFRDEKIDIVVHTACDYDRDGKPPHEVLCTNLFFSLRLLDAATMFNADTFLNTDTLLPKNLNTYALSKSQFVDWLVQRSRVLQIVNFRLEHMYGPGDDKRKFVSWLIENLQAGTRRIPLTEGNQLRDFIYIDDVVEAYLLLLNKAAELPGFSQFDVGTGVPVSVREFVLTVYAQYTKLHPDCRSELGFGDIPLRAGEPIKVDVNNLALKEKGWEAAFTIEKGVAQLLEGSM